MTKSDIFCEEKVYDSNTNVFQWVTKFTHMIKQSDWLKRSWIINAFQEVSRCIFLPVDAIINSSKFNCRELSECVAGCNILSDLKCSIFSLEMCIPLSSLKQLLELLLLLFKSWELFSVHAHLGEKPFVVWKLALEELELLRIPVVLSELPELLRWERSENIGLLVMFLRKLSPITALVDMLLIAVIPESAVNRSNSKLYTINNSQTHTPLNTHSSDYRKLCAIHIHWLKTSPYFSINT